MHCASVRKRGRIPPGADAARRPRAVRRVIPPPPPPRDGGRGRRWLRIVAWNLGLLVLAGVVGEGWLRLTTPFTRRPNPMHFEPGVGWRHEPGQTVYSTDLRDFWTVSRANSEGFLDREPIPPARARATCHLTVIGDSFVEARQVPIADKFHLVLETLARTALPRLQITTSALGWAGTGQVQQLALYDRYARRRSPKLVVLVFHLNDFSDNVGRLQVGGPTGSRFDRARTPWPTLARDEDGALRLRPPQRPIPADRSDGDDEAPFSPARIGRGLAWRMERAASSLYLFHRLREEWRLLRAWNDLRRLGAEVEDTGGESDRRALSAIYGYHRRSFSGVGAGFAPAHLGLLLGEAVEETGFALDQFVARTDRDGAELVILTTSWTGVVGGERVVEMIRSLAAVRGIPVVDQFEYLLRQGLEPERAHFRFDKHWNRTGHRWAAEAMLEHLRSRPPASCGGIEGGKEGRETADTLS